jgi:hypothetical protein
MIASYVLFCPELIAENMSPLELLCLGFIILSNELFNFCFACWSKSANLVPFLVI